MDELESVKQRVKKLLALSKSPNENEALSALRKANELMAEYKLSKAEFAGYVEKSAKATKRAVQWRIILANAVERLYATEHYHDVNTGNFVFIGEELDTFMSVEMYSYFVRTIDRMAAQNIRKSAKYNYRQSYRAGIASRLWDRMDKLGQQCSWRNPKALEQKKNEISAWLQNQIRITAGEAKKSKQNNRAFARGMNDGDSVNLSRQMTGSGTRRIGGV